MSNKCILLVGGIGSGKTTVANILAKYGFKEELFAGPIKEFGKLLGFTENQVNGTQQQKLEVNDFWGISGREFLQKFGTEVCRDLLPKAIPNMIMNKRTLWVRIMEQKINRHPLLVISDGRFPDEAKLVRDNNGIIIRITREANDNNKYNNSHKCHASETSMTSISEDHLIKNNGTLEDLENKVLDILYREDIINTPFQINSANTKGEAKNSIIDYLLLCFGVILLTFAIINCDNFIVCHTL